MLDTTYALVQALFKQYSPKTGLLPDFIVRKKDAYHPAQPDFLESENDGDFYYNACRFPWRMGTDVLMTGEPRAAAQLAALNTWIKAETGGDPAQVNAGYKLSGKRTEEDSDLSFTAPLMVSAMTSADNQEWLDALWKYNMGFKTADQVYYGNTVRLLCAIVVSGGWQSP